MKKLEQVFGLWVLKNRWLIMVGTLVLVALAASGGKNLSFTTNYRVFFSADNPQLLAFDALEKTYAKNDNVLIVLTPSDNNVFTPDTLAVVEEVTEKAWQIPYSIRVDSITNFQHTWAEGDDMVVENLVSEPANLSAGEINAIKQVATNEPLLVNRLVAPDGAVTGVNITVQLPRIDETKETPEVVAYARKIADEIRAEYPGMQVHLTGMAMMNNAFAEAAKLDMKTLVPLSFVVMLVALGFLIKGFTGTFATLIVIGLSIMTAMGAGGHIGFPLSPPSSTAPIIILTIAIANSVHVLMSMLQHMRRGHGKKEAIVESLRINVVPVTLASLTTAIGFLTMNFSDVPPFQHLGNFVAIGVAASWIMALTLLPVLMSLLPMRVKAQSGTEPDLMHKFGDFVVEKRRPLFFSLLALIVVLISFLPRNELNDVFVNYFDTSVTFRADTDYVTENLAGTYNISYSLFAKEKGGVSDPGFLSDVEAFAQWYRQQPETDHVNTFTDVMKRLNKNMHGDDRAFYRLPQDRELAAQYLLLYEMSLPYGLDLNDQINIDKTSTKFTVTMKTMSSNQILGLEKRANDWLAANAPHIAKADASGPSLMFAHIGKRNISSMLIGTSVALVLISLILIAAMRSIKIGTISLVPNLIPAAMGFGLWGLVVGEIGLALSVVSTMTLGIVVDDTVHFLSKYLRARREKGFPAQDAVRYAFDTVGRALFTTTIILVLGFLVLAFSSFKMNSGMGTLTAIVIAFALLADFLFLPPLLMKIEEKDSEQTDTVVNDGSASPSVS